MATETGDGTADGDDSVSDAQDSPLETAAADHSETEDDASEIEDDSSNYSQFARSAIVTTGSTLSGMAVAFISALYLSSPESSTSLLLVAAAVFLQFPIYRLIGLDVDDFGMKGNIYIAFMTFILWFVTLGIILTTGAMDAL